jgi:DsbC/DsbD-like thiol-disulfide interchange protein
MIRRLRAPLPARLAVFAAFAVLLLGTSPAPFAAQPPQRPGATLRLIVAGVVDGRAEAGVEIDLEPGWKTYWRTPGDAGIPPVVDWSRSTGLSTFDLRFPAPVRFGEEGVQSIGYTGPVILPIDLAVVDATRPASIDLDVQIGVCRDICVPISAHLTGTVSPTAPVDAAALARLTAARATLPLPAVKGVAPWVISLERDREADAAAGALLVKVKMPEDDADAATRDVLVEGPTGDWALPLPEKVAAAPGREIWRFDLDGVPRGAKLEGSVLRFTMRIRDRVVEQRVPLDAAVVAP